MCGFCDLFTLANLKDTAFIAGAATAIYVSLAGLSAWKTQLIGTYRIETIRKARINLVLYRENIKRIRNLDPTMGELAKPDDGSNKPDAVSSKPDRSGVQAYISILRSSYGAALKELRHVRAELETCLFELEADDLHIPQSTKDSLFAAEDELRKTVKAYIIWQDTELPQMINTSAWNVLDPRFEIVVPEDSNKDEFANNINEAIRKINKELKYLR